jgi:hypothetical protein
MSENKDNNNLDYIENPTMEYKEVVYKETEEQQTFNDSAENYYEEEEIYDDTEEPYNDTEEPYNVAEEPNADTEDNYIAKEEIYDNKEVARAKRSKIYSSPFYLPVFLYYFWPVGLYWMWKYKVYNKTARIIISIVMPIFGTVRTILRYTR